ncbi:HAMP domain-containing sensor histidine kinase [Aureibaculum sp. 2210JD6-5]|uniref:sensor histidine kinase n=1 Tax=Aureibaculum sp. 2210JD6-5 TaxID=3103957 RepID=UPI002AAE2D9E|nr:HAMP domain-containing sensor histidine kinase [Aureibaculum sp. 2210JD6-5]MDY7395534.1 HAMP domain-containing sensor histidine kinase [Aureibaculum sp. 2210JD6-5]
MSKRVFVLLIILMSIALIGIIAVQIYWINYSIDIRKKQFTNDVKFALAKVSENIQEREISDYYRKFKPVIDSASRIGDTTKKEFIFQQVDTAKNEVFSFRKSILENDNKSSVPLFESDSLTFKTFFGEKEEKITKIDNLNLNDFKEQTPEQRIYEVGRMTRLEAIQYEDIFKDLAPRQPIYDRIGTNEISLNLENELRDRGVDIKFEFGVFGDGLATKVKSSKFKSIKGKSYSVPLFIDNDGDSDYELRVTFPSKNEYILASITNILVLAAIFILVIMLAFGSAIYQLIKQKQISAIKTDFINNMTHEFKTPIATINLALDAIKNPKIINDKEKVLRYTEMIREENKRMHGQVENVLRISRLEKNQLDITQGVNDLHDIVEEAITHVELIIKDKGGYINLHLEALQSEVMVNKFHFTNVITNILDNAIKYTNEPPKIDIYTENAGNYIILHVKDQGIGMNKNVQKHVFDKFYREQKVNIHDVKGHGLGLSYVKKIVEHHHGNVYVASEKGKGSTFTIKLPLI